ncbi:MAG: amidohydrolase family protein [Bacillota bacterium]|nr:amidohydrolase family protein [Bacillota bacterium]
MYRTAEGEEIFVVDGHVHFWDASPANQANRYGKGFIDCFYDYHRNLSPAERIWPREKFLEYDAETMARDLFAEGCVDVAILQPTRLRDFFVRGFNTVERNAVIKELYPDRFILNGSFDPRDGEAGLEALEAAKERYGIRGVKLYTAEWRGSSRGYKLTDAWAYRYLEKCRELGIRNIHVHKGPTIWPLDRDAFDVADVDHAASDFPELNFIVEHVGLPRLEDFCWIATQEPNVYGGLAVAMPFVRARPLYFARVMAELLFWLGPDRLLFASDYAIWEPRWILDAFMAFQLPEAIVEETGVTLDLAVKRKILGQNAARLYDLDFAAGRSALPGRRRGADGAEGEA